MDLKAISTFLTNQESTFRTILTSASPTISGDALKSKLTSHYINLVLIARDRYPPSNDTLDDPFEFGSDSPFTSAPRKRREPPIEGQMTAVPVEKTTPKYANWQKAGGATLFGGKSGRGSGGRRKTKGKGVAVPFINLCDLSDSDEDDDSAGSAAEEEAADSIFISLGSSKRGRGGKRDRAGKKYLSREEKEAERNRDRMPGMGLGGKTNGLMVLIDSTKRGGIASLREREVDREIVEVDEETVTGFEGGKDGEGNDPEMEEAIAYYEDEENGAEDEGEGEKEVEEESSSKRRRSV
jgi:hypothetical protein